MQKNAIVRSLESPDKKRKNVVLVEPISSLKCVGCAQACSKNQQTIAAINSKELALKVNSIVKISTSKRQQIFEGFVSIFIPIAAAIVGFFVSNPIFSFFANIANNDSTVAAVCPESFKALMVIIFFAIASLCVLFMSRSNLFLTYPEITDVLELEH